MNYDTTQGLLISKECGFNDFIKIAHKGEVFDGTPEGDFIWAAAEDKTLPLIKSWKMLLDYLIKKGAHTPCLEAAKMVYFIWKKTHGSIKHPKVVKLVKKENH